LGCWELGRVEGSTFPVLLLLQQLACLPASSLVTPTPSPYRSWRESPHRNCLGAVPPVLSEHDVAGRIHIRQGAACSPVLAAAPLLPSSVDGVDEYRTLISQRQLSSCAAGPLPLAFPLVLHLLESVSRSPRARKLSGRLQRLPRSSPPPFPPSHARAHERVRAALGERERKSPATLCSLELPRRYE
jgi:hypothetical protein